MVKPLQTGVTGRRGRRPPGRAAPARRGPGCHLPRVLPAAARLWRRTRRHDCRRHHPSSRRRARTVDLRYRDEVDVVLVEGAGGLLSDLDSRGDLGRHRNRVALQRDQRRLRPRGEPSLGTLNHTALTAEALASRGLPLLGVVVGSYPAEPDLAEQSNLLDVPRAANAPLLGNLPTGAGVLPVPEFARRTADWLFRATRSLGIGSAASRLFKAALRQWIRLSAGPQRHARPSLFYPPPRIARSCGGRRGRLPVVGPRARRSTWASQNRSASGRRKSCRLFGPRFREGGDRSSGRGCRWVGRRGCCGPGDRSPRLTGRSGLVRSTRA